MAVEKIRPEDTARNVVSARAMTAGRRAVDKTVRTLDRLTVVYMPIDAVYPNDWNPNRQSEHDFELLLRSMEEDGFTQPVIVNLENKIIDGEHRWRAAKVLKYTDIPVVAVDMTEEQMRISTMRHNKARGSHDIELEAELLRDLQKLGAGAWAQDSLCLTDEEMERLVADINAPEALAGEIFSDAWVPEKFTKEERDIITGAGEMTTEEQVDGEGPRSVRALSQQAADQLRLREKLIKEAKTEQQRITARAESDVFKISLLYTGDEAKLIRSVLGDYPAQALLALCRGVVDTNVSRAS